MPRFVILRHDCPADYARPSHWDFMLESGSVLQTWAIRELLEAQAPLVTRAERLADHRLNYLEYEGPLTNNRGEVRRVESGTYSLAHDEKDFAGDAPDAMQLRLSGTALRGVLRFIPVDRRYWRLEWTPD